MRILPAVTALPIALLVGAAFTAAPHSSTDNPSLPAVTADTVALAAARRAADACASLNASSIRAYKSTLSNALRAAQADARANGANGVYKVAATNARDLLQRAYDRADQMEDFNQKSNPNATTYAEAAQFKMYLQTILKWLPDAAHWATISAAYHRSRAATAAFDGAVDAMQEGTRLFGEAGRCYTAPYLTGAATAG